MNQENQELFSLIAAAKDKKLIYSNHRGHLFYYNRNRISFYLRKSTKIL